MLESSATDPKLGRYSFLACDPLLTFRSKGHGIEIRQGTRVVRPQGNPFQVLAELLREHPTARPEHAPPLIAGAIGYFSYDLGRFVERIPQTAADDVPIADCHLGFYPAVATIDHVLGRAWVSAVGLPETDSTTQRKLAEERVERLAALLAEANPNQVGTGWVCRARMSQHAPRDAAPGAGPPRPANTSCLHVTSNFTRRGYLAAIARAKEYIAAGDIYQVNLSQRLAAPLATTPFDLYCRLRRRNPAPFAAYFETPEATIVSSSPERFLEIRGREVETRPIKGTRPRGATPQEDSRLAAELLASEKDRAENVMIVDLERNDIGRTCEFGSVHVPDLFALESYATVHHLVSTVRGRLRSDQSALDCLRNCFPGGSITGAPKVRSMEIIEELEPTRRGVYTGAIGYLCYSGDMDVNISIRTMVVKDGVAYLQAGGGIVADSDPEAEYQETLDKARGMAMALAQEAGVESVQWPG